MALTVEVRQQGTSTVVQVGERFDAARATSVAGDLARLAGSGPDARVVLDLTEVAPLEQGAVVALWAALPSQATVAVVTRRLTARRMLRRWGGGRALVFPTVEAAVEGLAAPGEAAGGGATGVAPFRHEAFLYDGAEAFAEGTTRFIIDGLAAGEPVFVAVGREKVELLRRRLGPDALHVRFADMDELGRNPARVIPAWQAFVDGAGAGGRPVRGVGEPITARRSAPEVVECEHHESLLNVAFARSTPWWLLCPYDTGSLAPAVVASACASHPFVLHDGVHAASPTFATDAVAPTPDEPLEPAPATGVEEVRFDAATARAVAGFVARQADAAGLRPDQVRDLARVVVEVAADRAAHGAGRLRTWHADGAVVCELLDGGEITDPLAGRRRPASHGGRSGHIGHPGDRGLWLANQVCDLVQLRSSPDGTVVRLHLRARPEVVVPSG